MNKTPDKKRALQLWHIENKISRITEKQQDIEHALAGVLEAVRDLRALHPVQHSMPEHDAYEGGYTAYSVRRRWSEEYRL